MKVDLCIIIKIYPKLSIKYFQVYKLDICFYGIKNLINTLLEQQIFDVINFVKFIWLVSWDFAGNGGGVRRFYLIACSILFSPCSANA